MSKQLKITVHQQEEHECGQIHEAIYYMYDVKMTMISSLMPIDTTTLDIFNPTPMEFTGNYNKVELNGIEVRGNTIVCKKCGKDILRED